MMISPAQLRAARALLNKSQKELAELASVSETTIRTFEAGEVPRRPATLLLIGRALQDAGVMLIEATDMEGEGVRLAKSAAA